MSGFEIVGVVLGSIPLIVSALEHYKEGVATLHRAYKFEKEFQSIKRQLRVQQNILKNVCETLLEDLGLGFQIEAMIQDPFGPLWQDEDTQRKLLRRLHRDYDVFEEQAKAMAEAVEKVKEMLDVGSDGKVKWMEGSSLKRRIKGAMFALNREQYQEQLTILKEGNTTLELLTRHNRDMEPKRKSRLQTRFLYLLRLVSRNVYQALRNSLSCRCGHGIGLELTTPKLKRELTDDDVGIVSDFIFRIGLSLGPFTNVVWKEILLRPYTKPQTVLSPHSQGTVPVVIKTKKKSVNFSQLDILSSGHQSQSITITKTNSLNSTAALLPMAMANISIGSEESFESANKALPQISDICTPIFKATDAAKPACYGLISNYANTNFSRFEVHPDQVSSQYQPGIVTLDSILRCQDNSLPLLDYRWRIKLAHAVAYAVLQLSQTGWLSGAPSSRDILFTRGGNSSGYDQVFVARDVVQSPLSSLLVNDSSSANQARNVLLALAILLIEIMLQKPFGSVKEQITSRDQVAVSGAQSDIGAARKLAILVGVECGPTFGSAIQRCVDCNFNCETLSLDDELFRAEFYAGVVALLEENVKNADLTY